MAPKYSQPAHFKPTKKQKTKKTIPILQIIQKFIQIPENKPKNTTQTTLNIEGNSTKRSLWLR